MTLHLKRRPKRTLLFAASVKRFEGRIRQRGDTVIARTADEALRHLLIAPSSGIDAVRAVLESDQPRLTPAARERLKAFITYAESKRRLTLGEAIARAAQRSRLYTLHDIAARAGLSVPTVRRATRGALTFNTLQRLRQALPHFKA